MAKIARFSPNRLDKNVGLKSSIEFTFTELAPFQPNSDSIPELPNRSKFRRLSDIQAIRFKESDAILYIDTTPDRIREGIEVILEGQDSSIKKSLVPATEQQIYTQIGANGNISQIRQTVRSRPSNFISIRYKDNTQQFQQLPLFSPTVDPQSVQGDPYNTSEVKLFRATKGEILDIATIFHQKNLIQPNALFTNFVIASTEAFTTVKQITNTNSIIVTNSSLFKEGSFITLVFSQEFLGSTDDNVRDVVLFKVKQINTGNQLVLEATEKYSLLSQEETELLNAPGYRILAIPGVPVLVNEKATSVAMSLYEAEASIEGEIPLTTLYLPVADPTLNTTDFVGNLYIPSVTVLLYEDDQEVPLVKEGLAQPGVSIDYKLITRNEEEKKYGDVEATIKLTAKPQSLSIVGITRAGSRALQVGARIMSTPDRSGIAQQSTTKGEYYFNRQIEIRGQSINVNKYGTIRLLDHTEIVKSYNGTETVIHKAQVQYVDEKQNLIILDKPVPVNLGIATTTEEQAIQNKTKYYLRIPQTPLNPGRRYRVVIHALDREEVRYDVNRDGIINTFDQQLVESRLNDNNLQYPNTADIDSSGLVDDSDLSLIKAKLDALRKQGVDVDR